jgi:hypothetical protein
LDLKLTLIDDGAIEDLCNMTTLTALAVDETGITAAGREQLRRDLPGCDLDSGDMYLIPPSWK